MTIREIRRRVARFRRMHRLAAVNYDELRAAVEKQGYTIIEFNHLDNDANVMSLLGALQLEELAAKAKGFTYADAHQRLIFLHEGLGEGERILVLAHEAGHIVCEHFRTAPIIGKDVQDEYEANEFAHYLLNPGSWNRTFTWCRRHGILVASVVLTVLMILGATGMLAAQVDSSQQTLYVTENGKKYHEAECMTLKQRQSIRPITREELESGAYEPCEVCLP